MTNMTTLSLWLYVDFLQWQKKVGEFYDGVGGGGGGGFGLDADLDFIKNKKWLRRAKPFLQTRIKTHWVHVHIVQPQYKP